MRSGLLAALLLPLACAVATEPELTDAEEGGSAGATGGKAGAPPIISSAGTSNAFGGTGSMPMTGGAAGMTGSAGKGGMLSTAGKASGGASQGGTSSAGANHGGAGTSGGSGGAAGGSGGAVSNGCSTLKAWKGGDSTLSIAAGEVVSWKGKRYKATAAIAYPNTECAPDAPAMWCANWFTPDGDC